MAEDFVLGSNEEETCSEEVKIIQTMLRMCSQVNLTLFIVRVNREG